MAIDGKTVRGSADGESSPLHMVSAFATDVGLALGPEAVADKSNEITAIPARLEALAVKDKSRTLRAALEDAFADVPGDGFEQVERSHGRRVVQPARLIENRGQIDAGTWAGGKRQFRVMSLRTVGDQRSAMETRCYIDSAELTHAQLHGAVRQHWAIENQLHWTLASFSARTLPRSAGRTGGTTSPRAEK